MHEVLEGSLHKEQGKRCTLYGLKSHVTSTRCSNKYDFACVKHLKPPWPYIRGVARGQYMFWVRAKASVTLFFWFEAICEFAITWLGVNTFCVLKEQTFIHRIFPAHILGMWRSINQVPHNVKPQCSVIKFCIKTKCVSKYAYLSK